MNEVEVSDFDRLKNLFMEFGLAALVNTYKDRTSLISIEGVLADCDFWFDSEGKFEEIILE